MNSISISDLFFIITGSAVIIITVMLAIGLLYVISFLRTVRTVAKTAQRATEIVSEDLSNLREDIKDHGLSISSLASFAKSLRSKKINNKK